MMNVDRFALQCDLAETYHIYNIKALPLSKVALFSVGLRADSRIMMKINNTDVTLEELLLASIVDRLTTLVWLKTKDGQKGKNRPTSIVDKLTKKEKRNDIMSFNSGKEFDEYRKKLIEKYEKGGN